MTELLCVFYRLPKTQEHSKECVTAIHSYMLLQSHEHTNKYVTAVHCYRLLKAMNIVTSVLWLYIVTDY